MIEMCTAKQHLIPTVACNHGRGINALTEEHLKPPKGIVYG